jgi:arginyl-tRNA--protein-N-Asp/Glu arginylyltransferase
MRHTLPIAPQFYVTAPQPCPYLDGRMERKLFTALQGEHAQRLNDTLSKQGFRRSQNVLYRPSCAECSACLSARIRVADFVPNRTQRRITKKNAVLRRNATSPWATEEQFQLFRRYLDSRHADGGMADMDIFEFAAMIEETPIKSRVIEYSRPAGPGETGRPLAAVCLTDVFDDGLSMVYSFYDPDLAGRSLGTYVILDHVEIAREAGLPYRLSGLLGAGQPQDGLQGRLLGAGDLQGRRMAADGRPGRPPAPNCTRCRSIPIAEQVARISLPEARIHRE